MNNLNKLLERKNSGELSWRIGCNGYIILAVKDGMVYHQVTAHGGHFAHSVVVSRLGFSEVISTRTKKSGRK